MAPTTTPMTTLAVTTTTNWPMPRKTYMQGGKSSQKWVHTYPTRNSCIITQEVMTRTMSHQHPHSMVGADKCHTCNVVHSGNRLCDQTQFKQRQHKWKCTREDAGCIVLHAITTASWADTIIDTDKVHENVHCIFLDMSACLLLVGNTLNRGNGHISTYNEH